MSDLSQDLEWRLRELLGRREIQDWIVGYCRGVDRLDAVGLGALKPLCSRQFNR